MKNKNKVKIIIELDHVDHSKGIDRFLRRLKDIGNMGGDLIVNIDGAEQSKMFLGHDVNIKKVQRIIFEENI